MSARNSRLIHAGGVAGTLGIGVLVALGLVTACSDDPAAPGAKVPDSGGTPDASGDAPGIPDADAAVDAPVDAADGGAAPRVLPISATRHVRLFNLAHDSAGGIFAVGQIGDTTPNADFSTLLVRLLPTGALDTTFGTNGVVTVNVGVGGAGENARGLVLQKSGKIVVAGTVEHAGGAADTTRDIVVMRFESDGTPDPAFGTAGIVRVAFGTGELVQQWGLAVQPNDDLVVVGARKAEGKATNEFAVFRLKGATGERDLTFAQAGDGGADAGADGVFALGLTANVSPKTAAITPSGGIVVSGYSNVNGNKPIVFKLTSAGVLDSTFGAGGVFFQESGVDGFGSGATPEAYAAMLQGDKIVTAGYGRENAAQPAVGMISLRLTPTGAVDTTYGTAGHTFIGINDQPAQARTMTVLADNRVVLVGGASPAGSVDGGALAQHAAVGILQANGAPDTAFAPSGVRLYDLGGPATGRANHFFWGAVQSSDKKVLSLVGIRGGVTAVPDAGVTGDPDQGIVFQLPLAP